MIRLALTAAMALGMAAPITTFAQTASPANRDTTIQTGGPSGTSGAVGPNDNSDGSDKDGTRPSTPSAQAAKTTHHHRALKKASTPLHSPGA
jgi:hypothetical protein